MQHRRTHLAVDVRRSYGRDPEKGNHNTDKATHGRLLND